MGGILDASADEDSDAGACAEATDGAPDDCLTELADAGTGSFPAKRPPAGGASDRAGVVVSTIAGCSVELCCPARYATASG